MKAVIIGATGMVGKQILKEVLNDVDFSEVRIFVRKPTGIVNLKLKEIVSPMIDIYSLSRDVTGDVLFNAMGTTIKQAGSQDEQRRIDRDIPIQFAEMAAGKGFKVMLNVSSVGASMKGNFYLKTKAEMEHGTEKNFPGKAFHFRPSMLVGDRVEFRKGEKFFVTMMKMVDPFLRGSALKYKSMPADRLARAMVKLSKNPGLKPNILHYTEIMELT